MEGSHLTLFLNLRRDIIERHSRRASRMSRICSVYLDPHSRSAADRGAFIEGHQGHSNFISRLPSPFLSIYSFFRRNSWVDNSEKRAISSARRCPRIAEIAPATLIKHPSRSGRYVDRFYRRSSHRLEHDRDVMRDGSAISRQIIARLPRDSLKRESVKHSSRGAILIFSLTYMYIRNDRGLDFTIADDASERADEDGGLR